MGEKSKLIGDYGEKSVEKFLNLIGWLDAPRNIQFACSKKTHSKKTHGLDFFFAYKSPLVDSVLKKLHISVKFTDNPYPNNPNTKFKEYFEDLVSAIDCFKTSQEQREITKSIKNYSSSENVGLIFWLSNDATTYDDLFSKLVGVQLPHEYNFDSVYVVDNKRIDFIYQCLKYTKGKFLQSDINFFYQDTGKNIIPSIKQNYGKTLPIEFMNSSLLALRIEDLQTQQTTLALFTIDPFDNEDLVRLIGLSQELSKSWSSKILICFPDYNDLRHSQYVRISKGLFEDNNFTQNVSVESFNENFKSLQL